MQIDPTIYFAHAAFWGAFGLTRFIAKAGHREPEQKTEAAPVAEGEKTAPFSKALLAFHMGAFGIMYWGIARAVFSGAAAGATAAQRIAGAAILAAGAALMCWALLYFRSWRFRAKLDAGHQLATGGPFRIFRHPIYMGLNLLALGSAVWLPSTPLWIGFALMLVGSDLRARGEEKLLEQAFGAAYRDYRARTSRFVPGLY